MAALGILLLAPAGIASADLSLGSDSPVPPIAHVAPLASPSDPWVGILEAQPADYNLFVQAGIRRVTVELGWDNFQPTASTVSQNYIAQERARITSLQRAGVQVVLDPGLQYPPSWVFALAGQTRFVDQYGDVWHGPTGSDVANAVFNPAVRAAEAKYISLISANLGADSFTAVRVGGLSTGELHYPKGEIYGRSDALWFYDPAAQRSAPYPGWTPGTGTVAEGLASLHYYYQSMGNYESFLLQTISSNFPKAQLQVLLPGWGLRPGQTRAAVVALLNRSHVTNEDSLSEATNYALEVRILSKYGSRAVVYSTWVDAASQGSSTAEEPPIYYLATLARKYKLALAGENTGTDTTTALARTFTAMKELRLSGIMWMSAPGILSNSGANLQTLSAAIATADNS